MSAGQAVRYAELTCTPYTSVAAGIPIEAYTEAIEDARVAAERDFGLVLRWIYDIPVKPRAGSGLTEVYGVQVSSAYLSPCSVAISRAIS